MRQIDPNKRLARSVPCVNRMLQEISVRGRKANSRAALAAVIIAESGNVRREPDKNGEMPQIFPPVVSCNGEVELFLETRGIDAVFLLGRE